MPVCACFLYIASSIFVFSVYWEIQEFKRVIYFLYGEFYIDQ
jgi:hypothetical protein